MNKIREAVFPYEMTHRRAGYHIPGSRQNTSGRWVAALYHNVSTDLSEFLQMGYFVGIVLLRAFQFPVQVITGGIPAAKAEGDGKG